MKKITIIAMAALMMVAASCKKDKKTEVENAGSGFRATVESHAGDGKTHLEGTAVKWNEDDAILVKSSTCTTPKRFATTGTDASAKFDAAEDLPADFYAPDYTAYYPATAFNGDQLTLPAEQTYVANTFASGANPMVAQSASTELPFKNVCGVMEFQFYSATACTVSSVTLTTNKENESLWGKGTVSFVGELPSLGILTEGGNSLTLSCGDGIAMSTDKTAPTRFMFVVPAGTLGESFSVTVTDSNGESWQKTATSSQNAIVRSQIKVMPKLAVATHTPVAPSEVTIADGCVNCTYTVSGSVTVPTGSHDCEFGLVYSVEDDTPTVEEGAQKIVVHAMDSDPVSGTVNFTADITSLTEDVRYYVRAYALCDEVAYSSEESVKNVIYSTPKPLPSAWNNGINPHAFSVGEGKQVYFSQGNLQYKPSTDTWRFAEHQFDMVDVVSGTHGTSDYVEGGTNWIDFFGWGTTGHNRTSEDPYYIHYQPWSTSNTKHWDTYNYYGYGPSTENPHGPKLLVEYYSDWGCNKIDNGGNAEKYGWYTLGKDELNYLLYTRTDAASHYAEGKVGCINGLIVLPDVWNLPQGLTFNAGFASGFNTNTYTYSQWALMESAGAVFLPAAGYRGSSTNYSVGTYGCYWASTRTYGDCGDDLDIQNKSVKVDSSRRFWGLSVRLVYPAN